MARFLLGRLGQFLVTAVVSSFLLFVITDGADNASVQTARGVCEALSESVTGEKVESMLSVLVGVNVKNKKTSKGVMLAKCLKTGIDNKVL